MKLERAKKFNLFFTLQIEILTFDFMLLKYTSLPEQPIVKSDNPQDSGKGCLFTFPVWDYYSTKS
jgi:hypothetical protein